MFDGRAGLSDADKEALALVRETGCPLIIAVNKIDDPRNESAAVDFYGSALRDFFLIWPRTAEVSPICSRRSSSRLPALESGAPAAGPDLRIALIGRPNVGKSSLLNRLSGFERAIVDSTPWHDARCGRCAPFRRRPRRFADRHRGNSPPDQGRWRARAAFGRPRDRDDSPRRGGAARDRCDRGNYRSGRAAGAPGRYQRSRDGPDLQQVGCGGEAGTQSRGVRSRRSRAVSVPRVRDDRVYLGAYG